MELIKGEKIVYGQNGVCEVLDICEKVLSRTVTKKYYTLRPIMQNNNYVYIPIDSETSSIRNVISKDEANALIDKIPEIIEKVNETLSARMNIPEYKEFVEAETAEPVFELAIRMDLKKKHLFKNHKKFGYIDEKYTNKSEEIVLGEFSTALGIEPDEVKNYIKTRLLK